MLDVVAGLLSIAILAGGVLAFAALGEVLVQRVGIVNLGVEGVMALGAVTAVMTVAVIPVPIVGFAAAILVGVFSSSLFATATVICRANQVLCGLAMTLIGVGISNTIGRPYAGTPAEATFAAVQIPILSDIPFFGRVFFSHSIPVYVAYLVLPLAIHTLLFKTRHGIDVRALGENPAAADAMGIKVTLLRFCYVVAGGALAAAAGAYLTLAFVPGWSDGVVAGRGWIAVSLVILGGFRPWTTTGATLLFGLVAALGFVAQAQNWSIAPTLLGTLPYLGTIAAMILPFLLWRGSRIWGRTPVALGVPYFRDQR